jgi:hypothetical protein
MLSYQAGDTCSSVRAVVLSDRGSLTPLAVEGAFTAIWSFVTIFFVAESPSKARWLSPPQRAAILHTLASDAQVHYETEKLDLRSAAAVFWAPHTLIMTIPSMCNGLLVFGLACVRSSMRSLFG